jgi:transcriptional regulator with XRE-family HTH domain
VVLPLRTPLDFSRVVHDIEQRGYSQRKIARAVGVAPQTVNNWANNTCEPRYKAGTRLMFLHAETDDSTPEDAA